MWDLWGLNPSFINIMNIVNVHHTVILSFAFDEYIKSFYEVYKIPKLAEFNFSSRKIVLFYYLLRNDMHFFYYKCQI